jgi:hypothetical protein
MDQRFCQSEAPTEVKRLSRPSCVHGCKSFRFMEKGIATTCK